MPARKKQSIEDVAKEGLEAVKAFLGRKRKPLPAQELLAAAYDAEPDVRRHLAEVACAQPIVAEENGDFHEAHAAVMVGSAEAMTRADERGADWNAPFYPYQGSLSPLEMAIKLDELAFAKGLLKLGVSTDNPGSSERWPETALTTAIKLQSYEAIRMLLAHGVAPTQSADLPGLGFDLAVLDALIAAGLDINVVSPGAAAGAWIWGSWSKPIDERIAWFRAMCDRGYQIGLEQLTAAMESADNNPETAEALCKALLDLGGEALAAQLGGADELMELAWEELTAKTLQRLAELGAPVTVKRVKRGWHQAKAKEQWLAARAEQAGEPTTPGLPTLGELMKMSDDLLTVDIVAAVLLGGRKQQELTLGGIRLGADATELAKLGLDDVEEVSWCYESETAQDTKDTACIGLELIEDDGKVTQVGFYLRLPDDPRVDAFWDALSQGLAARFGRKGKGRKGKRHTWEQDDVTVELCCNKEPELYPLEYRLTLEMWS